MGWKIATTGFVVGLAAMAIPNGGGRIVGVTAWAIALLVGVPLALIEKAKKRGRP